MRARNPAVLARCLLALLYCYSLSKLSVHRSSRLAEPKSQESLSMQTMLPLRAWEVALKREGEQSRTVMSGADGHFVFSDVPAGPIILTARRIGYAVRTVNLDVPSRGASSRVELVLEPVPSELASVIVEESRQHLAEFYDRKANSNFAKFFDQKDIKKRNPLYLSEMIRTVAGADVSSAGAGNRILLRGCQPMVWVDGMRAPGAELDDVARPGDVAGMEVYPSNAGLPPQYQDRNNRMCGAIMVWTKNQ